MSKRQSSQNQPKRHIQKSLAQQLRVVTRRIAGESIRQIARTEDIDRATVANILSQPELKSVLDITNSDLHRLLPKAVKAIEANLEAYDSRTAIAVLKGMQVFKPKSQSVVELTGADAEFDKMGLNRSEEDLEYFLAHG